MGKLEESYVDGRHTVDMEVGGVREATRHPDGRIETRG